MDQMLEPVDIIKAHLVNEGINESSHRKHLELQLLMKKREIQQIEEQIANMRLMDDMERPNSRVKQNRPNSQFSNYHNQSMQKGNNNADNNSEMGDDVETVKNSMINLLNVVLEDSNSQKHDTQPNVARGHNLIELSQEAVHKM